MHDVIIVGGGFAGLSAAMQLARARRRVLLVDAGRPRNRFAAASHGFLGRDGAAPTTIRATALAQLRAYPTFELRDGEVTDVEPANGAFEATLADGPPASARRIVLATGVTDTLPDLPGLAERWGVTVLHCPYCHGYEVCDRPLGVLATGPMAAHQAALLDARGVRIERSPVTALIGTAPALKAVRLADGRTVPIGALFVGPRVGIASPIAEALGCAIVEGPMGPYVAVDEWGLTSVPGVYAAGDAARAMHNATLASAAGVLAGIGAHRSLVSAAE